MRTGAVDTWPLSMRFGNNRVRLRIRRTLSVFAKPLFRSRPECADRFLALCLFKKMAEEIFYPFDLYFSQDFIYSQPNNKEAVCQPGLIVL